MSKKNSEFYVKIHDNLKGRVVAICDSDLLGKTLEDENFRIDVSKNFYGGDLADEPKVIQMLEKERNLNLIGKNIVELCIKLGIISKENVIFVNNIPHMQLIEP